MTPRKAPFGILCLSVLGLSALFGGSVPPASADVSLPGQDFLPDNRAWEMVSPVAKNGSEVMAASGRVRAAADGDAVSFGSLGGFGAVQGSGIGFDYLARRTGVAGTSGWVSHPLNPRQPASVLFGVVNGVDSNYVGEFTPNDACGVYRSVRPVTGIGSPADIPNLYLRTDLLDAGAGSFALLTVPLVPVTPAFRNPVVAGITDDCRHVLFESRVNLVPEASGDDPKLYEWVDGTLRLAGILPDGTPAADSVAGQGASSSYVLGMLSPDGSRVFFAVPSNGNVYMRTDGTTTVQMNASEKTVPESPQPAALWVVSHDGSRAFFTTNEGLVDSDTDRSADLYMFDADAPAGSRLTQISVDDAPGDGHFADGVLGVSADGSYVYFFSAGQLVAGEPTLGSSTGLYLWHDGEIRFIGQAASDEADEANTVGHSPGFLTLASRVSPDGRHLLFMTHTDAGFRGRFGFPGYDHGNCAPPTDRPAPCAEFYLYSADSDTLVCASCDPTGTPATLIPSIDARTGTGAANTAVHITHALSADGQRVFFHTRTALVPEDSNGRFDVYEYDVPTATVHLISSGKDPVDSYFMDASPNGDDVFFVTRQRLVGWDVDQNYDLYDARIGGGLPDPVPAPPACSGDACQGTQGIRPNDLSSASSSFHGVGNQQARKSRRHKQKHHKKQGRNRKHNRRPAS